MRWLSLTLIFFTTTVTAQQWIDSGATWYYGYENFPDITRGFYKVVYEMDTVIDGKTCQQLGSYNNRYLYSQNSYSLLSSHTLSKFYTYSSGDTVFFQNESFYAGFHVLFNINSQTNDSWELGYNYGTFCPQSSEYVDSTGTVLINSQTLRWVSIHHNYANNFGLSGKIIERIGCIDDLLLPIHRGCDSLQIMDFDVITFRCFQDSSFAFYNPSGEPCDFPFGVGINESSFGGTFIIYPNPATTQITIEFPATATFKNAELSIQTITGQVVYQSAIQNPKFAIDVSGFSKGLYLVKVLSGDETLTEKLILL